MWKYSEMIFSRFNPTFSSDCLVDAEDGSSEDYYSYKIDALGSKDGEFFYFCLSCYCCWLIHSLMKVLRSVSFWYSLKFYFVFLSNNRYVKTLSLRFVDLSIFLVIIKFMTFQTASVQKNLAFLFNAKLLMLMRIR